jgi:endoglucanase
MNYILGRNPLDQSYITGYGERPADEPAPPLLGAPGEREVPVGACGCRVGRAQLGPAGSLRQAAGLPGCAPQKCFVDNIEAWSANEMAINWNAPLAWVAAFLDEKAGTGAGKKGKK